MLNIANIETPLERAEQLAVGVVNAVLTLKQFLDRNPSIDFNDIEGDIDDAIDCLTDCSLLASFHRRMAEIEPAVLNMLADKAARMQAVGERAERLRVRNDLTGVIYGAWLQYCWEARFPQLHLDRSAWLETTDADRDINEFNSWWG